MQIDRALAPSTSRTGFPTPSSPSSSAASTSGADGVAPSHGSRLILWPPAQSAPAAQGQWRACSSSSSKSAKLHTAVLPKATPDAADELWRSTSTFASTNPAPGGAAIATSKAPDPFALVQGEVDAISERLRRGVTSSIPVLTIAAEYFFRTGVEGKRLRPTLIMLMAGALSAQPPGSEFLLVDTRPASEHATEPRRRQQRIAEIAELIHVASLLHDDVIDEATTRRGVLSLNSKQGNKMAILAGDFLLARASVSLAALRNTTIVELLSQVLEHLVTGEVMQMTATQEQMLSMEHYLEKTYCKTASLMANSSRAIAILAGHPHEVCDKAWSYGRHLGLAFQVVDDVLDLTASSSMLGKPAHNDLRSGLATAPVLFAAEQQPALRPLIARRFKEQGDVSQAVQLIEASNGTQRARELAQQHCAMAVHMIQSLPPALSDHAQKCRDALVAITQRVLNRKK